MKLPRNNKGTAIVEFAIILPLLLALLLGIIEFGIILFDKAMITNASREGARAGIVFRAIGDVYSPMTQPEIENIVTGYLQTHLVSFDPAASISTSVVPAQCPPLNQTAPPRQITVTVTYPYTFLVLPNLVTSLIGFNPLNLAGESTMRCE